MSARFSESEAALIDAARGIEERGVWLRRVALVAARQEQPRAKGKRTNAPTAAREPESAADIVAALRRRNGGQG